jgi:ERCC4-type nuclease
VTTSSPRATRVGAPGRRTEILVSAAEPPVLRALGVYSDLPEAWGADFLIPGKAGWCAVQRKEVADYVASKRQSDRLSREVDQMANSPATTNIVLIEGNTLRFGHDPHLRTFSRYEYMGDMLKLQSRGIWVAHTASLEETAEFLTRLPVWLADDTHSSLLRVPKTKGMTTVERMLTQLPKCSNGRAKAITDVYPTPLKWSMGYTQMLELPGFGPKTTDAIYGGLA